MSKFSDRFRQLKDESGMTLKDISGKLDITVPNLSYYMKGREPSYDVLIKIADFFHVTTDWLIGHTDGRNISSLDLVQIIEKDIIPDLFKDKLTGKALNDYLEIQDIVQQCLSNIYILYCAVSKDEDFLDSFHLEFINPISLIEQYIEIFAKFIWHPEKKLDISKKNISRFLNSADLIAEVISSSMLYPSCQYADFLSQTQDVSKEDYEDIHTLIDFVIDKLDRKYQTSATDNLIKELKKSLRR